VKVKVMKTEREVKKEVEKQGRMTVTGSQVKGIIQEKSRKNRRKEVGLAVRRVAFGGFWWLLVAFGGFWWLLVAFGGFWWLLVAVGDFWWILVAYGGFWWLLVAFGGFWWLLVAFGGFWWFLMASGGFWSQSPIGKYVPCLVCCESLFRSGTHKLPIVCVQCHLVVVLFWSPADTNNNITFGTLSSLE